MIPKRPPVGAGLTSVSSQFPDIARFIRAKLSRWIGKPVNRMGIPIGHSKSAQINTGDWAPPRARMLIVNRLRSNQLHPLLLPHYTYCPGVVPRVDEITTTVISTMNTMKQNAAQKTKTNPNTKKLIIKLPSYIPSHTPLPECRLYGSGMFPERFRTSPRVEGTVQCRRGFRPCSRYVHG